MLKRVASLTKAFPMIMIMAAFMATSIPGADFAGMGHIAKRALTHGAHKLADLSMSNEVK